MDIAGMSWYQPHLCIKKVPPALLRIGVRRSKKKKQQQHPHLERSYMQDNHQVLLCKASWRRSCRLIHLDLKCWMCGLGRVRVRLGELGLLNQNLIHPLRSLPETNILGRKITDSTSDNRIVFNMKKILLDCPFPIYSERNGWGHIVLCFDAQHHARCVCYICCGEPARGHLNAQKLCVSPQTSKQMAIQISSLKKLCWKVQD